MDAIAGMAVLPNRFLVKLDPTADFFKSYYAHEGVLRFTIKSGHGFKSSGRIIKDKPDVYCITKFGADPEFETETIDNTENPEWNASRDFLLSDLEQELQIAVWESDVTLDDLCGYASVLVKNLLAEGGDMTLSVKKKDGTDTGANIVVKGEHFSFTSDKVSFEASDVSKGGCLGYLTVIVASAKNLPKSDDMSSSVKVALGDYEQSTHSIAAAQTMPGIDPCNPYWDKAFEIPLTKERLAEPTLSLTVMDKSSSVGTVTVDVKKMLSYEGNQIAKEFKVGKGATLRSMVILRGLAKSN